MRCGSSGLRRSMWKQTPLVTTLVPYPEDRGQRAPRTRRFTTGKGTFPRRSDPGGDTAPRGVWGCGGRRRVGTGQRSGGCAVVSWAAALGSAAAGAVSGVDR
ncbi:hypothetical protein GCM10022227_45820 [Streptomyces sedi]